MRMRPIALAALLAFATALTGCVFQDQQSAKVYRVGALFNRGPNQNDQDVELLRQGLARIGYVEGTNIVLKPASPKESWTGFQRLPPNLWLWAWMSSQPMVVRQQTPPKEQPRQSRSSRPWLLTQSLLASQPRSRVQEET